MTRLIIDCSNIYHRAFWTCVRYADFKLSEEKSQAILARKFITDLMSLSRRFNEIDQIILCFDGSKPFRKKLNPEYKKGRKKLDDSFYVVLNECTEILKNKGFNVMHIHGLEADDLMALSVETNHEGFNVLISNDVDVRTLASDNAVIYTANSKNLKLYCDSLETISNHFNVFSSLPAPKDPKDHLSEVIDTNLLYYYKFFLGCKTDNVASLLPFGNGERKVMEIYDRIKGQKDISLSEILKNEFGFNITPEQMWAQNQLIGLFSIYMPEDKVYEFDEQIKTVKPNNISLKMEDVVKGTKYEITK